jgi:hypothetical protein
MAVHGLHRKLRWSDFRKIHESPNGHDAQTFTNISVQTRFSFNGQANWRVTRVNVTLSLNQLETWVVRGREQSDLLAHEQRHYDISAVAARTLEQRLNDLHGDRSQNPQEMINQISNDILGERTADGRVISRGVAQDVQDRYDEDATCGSDHGRNRDNQALWTLNISRVLADGDAGIDELNSCPRPRATPKAARQ